MKRRKNSTLIPTSFRTHSCNQLIRLINRSSPIHRTPYSARRRGVHRSRLSCTPQRQNVYSFFLIEADLLDKQSDGSDE
ncbi:MAG: hypothetical protein ACK5JU_00825 [Bacteroidales bacterium]